MGSVENMIQTEPMMAVASNSDLPRRRRVFAVRDFPPGCGRFAPVVSRANEGVVCVGTDAKFSVRERINNLNGNLKCPETVAQTEFKSSDSVLMNGRIDIAAEEPGVLLDSRNGNESVRVETVVVRRTEALIGSNQVGDVKSEALQHKAWDGSNDMRKVGNCAAVAGTFQKKKFPVRRSMSAVRDFPPFCGKNAPLLCKSEAAEMVSYQENKVLGQDRCHFGEETLKVTEKADASEMNRDVDGGDTQEKFSVTSSTQEQNLVLKFKLLPLVPKGTVVLGLMATPNCPWRQKKLHQFGSVSEIVTKLGGESRGLENLGKELVVCVENSNPVEKLCDQFCSEDQKSVEEKLPEYDGMSEIATKSGNDSCLENVGKELVTYVEEDRNFDKQLSVPCWKNQKSVKVSYGGELPSNESVVQGLMATQTCPWRRQWNEKNNRHTLSGGTREAVGKKNNFILPERSKIYSGKQKKKIKKPKRSKTKSMSSLSVKECQDTDKVVVLVKECEVDRSHNIGVSIPPISIRAGDKASDNDANVTRNQVRETLRLYQAVVRKLLQQKEANAKEGGSTTRRIDYQAAKILKEKKKYVNAGKPIIGIVPGVEVGDEFHYWVELNIIGLHRPSQAGIDYVRQGHNILATSIVASCGYDDDTDNSDVLIYTGQGGSSMGADKEHMDQKLERGNLALKNSIDEQNPVRVIRGETKSSSSPDSRGRTYIYDGLYLVQKYWQEIGPHGTLVFRFKLVRIPGQPELAWKAVKRSKKLNAREGLCVDDISQGKEKIPICAVNTIDDQKPPPFEYVTHNIYRDLLDITPPVGCDCTNVCSESRGCSCVAKNGGEIPYNHDGAIVEAKPLVYECGPRCKCPPSCYNRVTQHGIRFQLEIFKTDTRGWGVRSLNSIPSGSFICEYVGELLKDTEAEQRTGNDEYLFDIGNDYNESSLWDGLSTLVPEVPASSKEFVEEGSFTIDAAQYGNVGRFVNHSCSPNLYAQNVLYDHGDKRIPHIMLFAAENIPPLQELTYNYNYIIDQVFDSNGNIKKKHCYCGSSECTGRMY